MGNESFNVDKWKVMHVGLRNPSLEYKMNGKVLACTELERDICVLVHKTLKPSKHEQRPLNVQMESFDKYAGTSITGTDTHLLNYTYSMLDPIWNLLSLLGHPGQPETKKC